MVTRPKISSAQAYCHQVCSTLGLTAKDAIEQPLERAESGFEEYSAGAFGFKNVVQIQSHRLGNQSYAAQD